MRSKTKAEFVAATGRQPKDDDMQRANCVFAGEVGHFGCGWCEHDKPVFECAECFAARCNTRLYE